MKLYNSFKIMTKEEFLRKELDDLKELVYDKCGFIFSSLKLNNESIAYGACTFELNGRKIEYRRSKITPTKVGQFVTVWKRNEKEITVPLDYSDNFDFIVITSKSGDKMGQFIFPKSVLLEKGIISRNGNGGKRGIRVYPLWDVVTNRQAKQTRSWQAAYFFSIDKNAVMDVNYVRTLLTLNAITL
jgi:hypothetical protein